MKDVFSKNMESMQKTMPFLKEICLNKIEEKHRNNTEENEAFAEKSAQGETIFSVIKSGRRWHLNSRYCAQKAVDIWAQGI
jgi:hypothetical protein